MTTTTSRRRTIAALAAGGALALPGLAAADPPAAHPAPTPHKNYSMNSVNGDYTPPVHSYGITPIHTQVGPAVTKPAPSASGSSFSVGDAAAGAGIALLVTGAAGLGGRTLVRRRRVSARLGS